MSLRTALLSDFLVVGISHWYAELDVRERFSLSNDAQEQLLREADALGLGGIIVLSTCNRTELFTRGDRPEMLMGLLIKYSHGTRAEFEKYGFTKRGEDAVHHFFRVSVGLDAQILGDLQIIKQVKTAYDRAGDFNMLDGVMHRCIQSIFRAHKRSRTETSLGSGAATTAYAAVQAAKHEMDNLRDKRVLLIGTGKIGKVTCLNLINMGVKQVTLLNRSAQKAERLAERFQVDVAPLSDLHEKLPYADLVIVATGAQEPIITADQVSQIRADGKHQPLVMMDLSVPRNIDPAVGQMDGVRLINMDMLNDRLDATYREREANIPLVEDIITEEINDFKRWLSEQRVVPTIRALTAKLEDIRSAEMERYTKRFSSSEGQHAEQLTRRIVNKILAYSIDHLKEQHEHDDHIARVVQDMFKIEVEK
ncbi:MAG: glutamyl-tRNA reductase [Bacteroidetes bacterium]|nr:glutamyl-tRNA reductase [Bacteroidota bacterium]